MSGIERITASDAHRINAILNHPEVRPWVADVAEGVLDITPQLMMTSNVCLMSEHGGCFFFRLMQGIYEVHTQVLPAGRGAWAKNFTREAAHWMFTHTEAFELLTRVPHGHIAAKAATLAVGATKEFTGMVPCRFRGRETRVDIYRLSLQEWVMNTPELAERGAWLHERLHQEADRLGITAPPHAEDEGHNRYAGACIAMAMNGQVRKAVAFYNRWALLSRHRTIAFVSDDPPVIRFDLGDLKLVNGNDVEVVQL